MGRYCENAGEVIDQLKKDEIISTIAKYAPPNPKEDIVKAVKDKHKESTPRYR
ncbi:MAG: hypothetical protein IPL83_08605 [Bdellovibrionales bacterium]|nr:hypothetical protein [Bdellovibrionales bacterium]